MTDRSSPESATLNLPEQITAEIACILENCSGPEHQSEEALACLMQGYQSTWEQLREVLMRDYAQTPSDQLLANLVDWTWIHATEGAHWPSAATTETLIRKAKERGGPTQEDAGRYIAVSSTVQPHAYSPDAQAMGDCRGCGHSRAKPWHTDTSPEGTK
jgi:hypothetical protein